MKIDIAYDTNLLEDGINYMYHWNLNAQAQSIVIGASGTGKSYLVDLLLARFGLQPKAQVVFCNFKSDGSYDYLQGCGYGYGRYYEYNQCREGFDRFYRQFHMALEKGKRSEIPFKKILVFDEWAGYLTWLTGIDKKAADEDRAKMAQLLMMGRSVDGGYHVLISQQRADAEYFKNARENFSLCIGLGNLSKESKSMLFSGFADDMEPVQGRGVGYMLRDGAVLSPITVPTVTDVEQLRFFIETAVVR